MQRCHRRQSAKAHPPRTVACLCATPALYKRLRARLRAGDTPKAAEALLWRWKHWPAAPRSSSLMTRAMPPLPALLPALFLLQLCAFAGSRSLPDIRGHDLPGWQGERSVERRRAAGVGTDEGAASPVFLSWSPRIILVERFLSKDEAAHIIDLARCVAALSTRLHAGPIDLRSMRRRTACLRQRAPRADPGARTPRGRRGGRGSCFARRPRSSADCRSWHAHFVLTPCTLPDAALTWSGRRWWTRCRGAAWLTRSGPAAARSWHQTRTMCSRRCRCAWQSWPCCRRRTRRRCR